MTDFLHETTPVARKDYYCDACEDLRNHCDLSFGDLTFSERKSIAKAKKNNWKISKGQRHIKRILVDSHEIITMRVTYDIDAICIKYDLYDED